MSDLGFAYKLADLRSSGNVERFSFSIREHPGPPGRSAGIPMVADTAIPFAITKLWKAKH